MDWSAQHPFWSDPVVLPYFRDLDPLIHSLRWVRAWPRAKVAVVETLFARFTSVESVEPLPIVIPL